MISEEKVRDIYRLLLQREPESEEIVARQMELDSLRSLLWQCLHSDEFLGRYRRAIHKAFDV